MLYLVLSEDKLANKLAEGRAAAGETLKKKILECLKEVGGQDGIAAAAAGVFDAMIAQARPVPTWAFWRSWQEFPGRRDALVS
jgi:hypothetical protein